MPDHEKILNKYKRLKSGQAFFYADSGETRNQLQEKNAKITNTWRLCSMLLNNQWFTKEIKEKKFLNLDMKEEKQWSKIYKTE